MAEDQKEKAPWKESVWVQSSRDPKRTNFDALLEEALRRIKVDSEVKDKR
jgi:ferredoxin-NADP reductase